ncbi:NADH dehydrogenase [ubiquinone] 1 alpha subcomplex assembly factor 3-like [Uranotaenia lowii]|uniref:NADH dehydrogenase [ubiquinone] 1 alpha subcomplex assembly factor 3-like n=1 Tax=Uranotaenia lowii TaxID=190385 RepID=UPI0024799C5E|nr:NADH dehydrogenase [ubiquinone] 1 alpha subcomplex assembly factor 3-like [Uranotaenia lowii]XP_055613697.1 NADH dehydrogenase [ubiquinone] 1 alpha subcomplex assembly factor 3-like [Uranotaenia lowii]
MQLFRELNRFSRLAYSRYFSTGLAKRSAYEGDGKTSVSILNMEDDSGLLINSYSQLGFRLNNQMMVLGPMAIFPRSVLSWNVETAKDINEHSLSLFTALDPKIDILVIGIGDQSATPAFNKKILEFMRKYRINVEVLNTEQACATFNFLNAEARMVAAALIPPVTLRVNEDDLLRRQLRMNESLELLDKNER